MTSEEHRCEGGASLVALFFVTFRAGKSAVSLFDESKSDTSLLWKSDHGLLAGAANHENVAQTGSEVVACFVLNVDNLVRTWVVLNVLEDTNTTDIVSALNVNLGSVLEFNHLIDVSSLQVKLQIKRRIKYIIDFLKREGKAERIDSSAEPIEKTATLP